MQLVGRRRTRLHGGSPLYRFPILGRRLDRQFLPVSRTSRPAAKLLLPSFLPVGLTNPDVLSARPRFTISHSAHTSESPGLPFRPPTTPAGYLLLPCSPC